MLPINLISLAQCFSEDSQQNNGYKNCLVIFTSGYSNTLYIYCIKTYQAHYENLTRTIFPYIANLDSRYKHSVREKKL